MYADQVTEAMETAISETERRRAVQKEYNEKHGITPKTIVKKMPKVLEITAKESVSGKQRKLTRSEREKLINDLTKQMKDAAKLLDFEQAAYLRDRIRALQEENTGGSPVVPKKNTARKNQED